MNKNDKDWDQESDLDALYFAYSLFQKNPSRGLLELERLALGGSPASMVYLAWAYQHGIGTELNHKKAEEWYRKSYERGSLMAVYYLGHFYLDQKERLKAIEIFSAGAKKDYVPALFCLGKLYIDQENPDKEQQEEGYKLLKLAAENGHVFAKRNLAKFYFSGELGERRIIKSIFLFISAFKDAVILSWRDSSSDKLLC